MAYAYYKYPERRNTLTFPDSRNVQSMVRLYNLP